MTDLITFLLEPTILQKPVVQDQEEFLLNEDFVAFLKVDRVKSILSLIEAGETVEISELSVSVGVAALQLFFSINWLGHKHEDLDLVSLSSEQIQELLTRDGDSLCSSAEHVELLAVAKILLVDDKHCDNLGVLTWALRCCCILAHVLEEKSDLLYMEASDIVTKGMSKKLSVSDKVVGILFHLQVARHHSLYYKVNDAEASTEAAAALLGLKLTETGALGKRTKYQSKDVAQFCIDLVTDNPEHEEILELSSEALVTDVRLEDELRLDRIKYADNNRGLRETDTRLSGLQQSVLAAKYHCKVESIAVVDSLTLEEVTPYLSPILHCPQSWSLHCAALLARSKLEAKEGRTVERSLAQLETCLENIKLGNTDGGNRKRLAFVSTLPPTWEVERMLGKLLISLGLTKAALEVFLRLEAWEEVIVCYTLLELRHKAAEIIKERLKEKETSRMWCLLGDATDDLECYHTALKLSNNRSARAYRSLGIHHYFRKEYPECIPLFEKSLDLSGCQPLLILRLAFSAMETENWELAAKSYRNYCSYEMDNFEAWNNLANCYVKLGQKERAWRVLQEAVRCDFENWKVWDNLMVISLDIGAFNDVIRSYSRILDIKQTHMDRQLLPLISRAVIDDMKDIEGKGAGALKDKLKKLLARITVAMPKEATGWKVYGDIIASEASDQTEYVRSVQCYQKSLAAHSSNRGWERSEEACLEVGDLCLTLMGAVYRVSGAEHLQLASSVRMSVSSAVKMISQGQTNIATGDIKENVKAKCEGVQEQLSLLTDRIAKLREG